jgi:hypothetical protein
MNEISRIGNTREPSFAHSSFFGGLAHGLEVLSGGHVLDRIKVHCETAGKTAGIMKSYQEIISKEGITSLYKGFKWNVLLSTFKGSSGWLINNFSNRTMSEIVPQSLKKSAIFPLSVGLMTAMIEGALIITPLERIKIIEMTTDSRSPLSLAKIFKKHGPAFFFVGLQTVIFRQSITWCSYLCFYDFYKRKIEKYSNAIPSTHGVAIAALTGSSVCFVNSPLDFYKTQKQMLHALPNKNMFNNIKYLISKFGIQSFYSNLRIKILRSSFSCIFIVSFLDYMNALPLNMKVTKS